MNCQVDDCGNVADPQSEWGWCKLCTDELNEYRCWKARNPGQSLPNFIPTLRLYK